MKVTIKAVNNAIAKKWPLIKLIKGNGYFYIVSDDKDMGLKLAGLFTTSIGVYKINDLTIEKWLYYVEQLLLDNARLPSHRSPAI